MSKSVTPERLLLAAQAACPYSLDPQTAPPPGLTRLHGEFMIANPERLTGHSPALLFSNLRLFAKVSETEWHGYLLRDVAAINWRETHRRGGEVALVLRDDRQLVADTPDPEALAERAAVLARAARTLVS